MNLRDMKVSPSMAKDVTSTGQLDPNAHKTSAESSSNETVQYETKGGEASKAPLGAQNSNS